MVMMVIVVMALVEVAVMVTVMVMVMVPAKEHPDHSHTIYSMVLPRCHVTEEYFASNN